MRLPQYLRQKPRHEYKMHTCPNCGREHKRFAFQTIRGGVVYRGACSHCGVEDYARGDNERGHLEVGHEPEPCESIYAVTINGAWETYQ